MTNHFALIPLTALCLYAANPSGTPSSDKKTLSVSPAQQVNSLLDDWHLAAAQADEKRYFAYMAENAVFLGTDAKERWDKKAFLEFAHPHFAKGKAWSFKVVRRGLSVIDEKGIAYFDEDLDTPNMGPCRGSGVLQQIQGTWKILQYNLTVPIPNDLMDDVKKSIGSYLKKPASAPATPNPKK